METALVYEVASPATAISGGAAAAVLDSSGYWERAHRHNQELIMAVA